VASASKTRGQLIAAIGGGALIASLWLPWYTFRLPSAALDYATNVAHQYGALAPLLQAGANMLRQLGPLHFTAWQVLTTTPAILLVCGALGGGLAALSFAGRAAGAERLSGLAGLVAAGLAGYRIVVPPGAGDFVHPTWGLYLALIAGLVLLAGSAVAQRDIAEPQSEVTLDLTPPITPAWHAPRSVPPPGH
jgi:hypothetical protein